LNSLFSTNYIDIDWNRRNFRRTNKHNIY